MSLMFQNFILFQVGWFSCVLGGGSDGLAWLGVAVASLIVAVHLYRAGSPRDEMVLVMMTMLVGTLWDGGLTMAGIFIFEAPTLLPNFAPYWLIAMWALFATTLNVSLKWLKGRYLLAAIFGALGGPLAYYAGHRLGAVEFSDTFTAMLAVAAGWSVIMPLLLVLAARLNGYNERRGENYEAECI